MLLTANISDQSTTSSLLHVYVKSSLASLIKALPSWEPSSLVSVSLEDVLKLSKTLGSLEITSQGDPELLRVGG